MIEVWKDVVGYEDYFQVSNTGKIFSKRTKKELKLHTNKNGYIVFATRFGGRNGKNKCLRVHILVANAFIDNIYNKPTVNHIDGDKKNNNVTNLEWATNSEQQLHAHSIGLHINKKGQDVYNSKFTNEDIDYIRNVYTPRHKDYSGHALARKFDVHHSTIMKIVNKKTYNNV